MKKYCLAFILLTGFFCNRADAQEFDYTILEDNPYQIDNFYLQVVPFYVGNNYEGVIDAGYGAGATYILHRWMTLDASLQVPYSSQFVGIDDALKAGLTDNAFHQPLRTEGGVTFHMWERMRSRKMALPIGRYATRTLDIYSKRRTVWGLRAGMHYYQSIISSDYFYPGEVDPRLIPVNTVNVPYTNISAFSLYGGVSWAQLRNLFVDVPGYGENSSVKYDRFFLDLFYAPEVSTDPLLLDSMSFDLEDHPKAYVERDIGIRAGLTKFIPYRKHFGFFVSVEAGFQPGLENVQEPSLMNEYYTMARLAFTWHTTLGRFSINDSEE